MVVSDHKAFTLLEIMVVVAIVGVLASMVIPNFSSSVSTWRSNRYANSVWSSLRNAKFTAISENRPVNVRFKLNDNGEVRFFINDQASGGGSWSPVAGLYPMKIPEEVEIASVGTKSGDESGYVCFEFATDGTISKAHALSSPSKGCTGPGTTIGQPIIHIAPASVALTDSNTCLFSTIYLDFFQPNPMPQLLNFGAEDEFSADRGDNPC